MNSVVPTTTTQAYVERFENDEARIGDRLPAWLRDQRRAALARFSADGFPDPRAEEWKYTNVRPIAKRVFGQARPIANATEYGCARVDGLDGPRLVFVNGFLSPELSRLDDGIGLGLLGLDGTTQPNDAVLNLAQAALGQTATFKDNSFAAFNTAFMREVAVVDLPPDTSVEQPISLIFLSVPDRDADAPVVCHPRVLIRAGLGARAHVIEQHWSAPEAENFVNNVCEIVVGESASLEYTLLQSGGSKGYRIGSLHARVGADATLTTHNMHLGGRLVRNDLNVNLEAPGGSTVLNGVFMANGREHIDNHTRIHHAAPHTRSDELYRGVLDGYGRGVFKGRVLVERGAQKIEAHQSNSNLLLSDTAEVDTKPELEIYADDVICSHGATVGQIDPKSLYYLRSRGIDERTAYQMLVLAFATEVVERQPVEPVREWIEHQVGAKLGGPAAQIASGEPAANG